jgi:hypothetical protein
VVAPWRWWEALPFDIVTGRAAMIILGIILSFLCLAYVCWLLFSLAVYAVPLLAALATGLAAYHSGAGPIGSAAVGLMAAAITVIAAQSAYRATCSELSRASIAILFAAPAGIAGYHAGIGLAHMVVPAGTWQHIFAVGVAIVVATTAWTRLRLPPGDAGRDVAAGPAQSPLSTRRSSKTAQAAVRLKVGT